MSRPRAVSGSGHGAVDQGLRNERVSPESLNLHPFDPGMLLATAIDRSGHLLFYVSAEEKVRLHDHTADRPPVPAIPSDTRAARCCRIRDRLGQRRPGRGHEPEFDAGRAWARSSRIQTAAPVLPVVLILRIV